MLAIENLDVFYGDAQALDGVSLTVGQGEIVAIVGANGAGKTSLIRAIAGMVRPAAGRVLLHGSDIAGLPTHRICDLGIGQVAEGRQVFPTMTVLENLEMGALLPRARGHQANPVSHLMMTSGIAAATDYLVKRRLDFLDTAHNGKFIIDHTEVDEAYGGKGLAKQLVYAGAEYARKNGKKVIPLCTYAKATFDKNQDLQEILSQ